MADQHHPTPVKECSRNNIYLVSSLYKALASRDATTVHHLLAPNIDWWFHGPPSCNRLMRLLTGCTTTTNPENHSFDFNPISVVSIGSMVVAEGYFLGSRKVSWVHAWMVADGVITQVREYFNTSVTVTCFAKSANVHVGSQGYDKCQCVWQSKLTDNASMPGLLLAV